MDKDGTLEVNFGEWRDYLLFHPSSELHDIIQYWRHSTVGDLPGMHAPPPPSALGW